MKEIKKVTSEMAEDLKKIIDNATIDTELLNKYYGYDARLDAVVTELKNIRAAICEGMDVNRYLELYNKYKSYANYNREQADESYRLEYEESYRNPSLDDINFQIAKLKNKIAEFQNELAYLEEKRDSMQAAASSGKA